MKLSEFLLVLILLLSACAPKTGTSTAAGTTAPPIALPSSPIASLTPTPLPLPVITPTPSQAPGQLPHSLYFIDMVGEVGQVWRMDIDGVTRVQITHEAAGVEDYAVSPLNGLVAFISQNQLFLVDGRGANRRLVADDSQLAEDMKGTYEHGQVGNPVFSPDGQTLAYSLDGLHLYDLASGEDQYVLQNLGNLLGTPFVFDKELYAPAAWSPDGSRLLISMAYFEGSTLAVMQPGAQQPFRRLWSDGPVCCSYTWTPGSRSVLVANPDFSTQAPGLWRYDAETGQETLLLGGIREDGWMEFAGWPVELPSSDLLFFHALLERLDPDVGIPLKMVRSDPSGKIVTQPRPEEFHIIQALWAPDGSLAVISGRCCGGGRQVFLVRPDGNPLEVLVGEEENPIQNLVWGP